MSNFREQCETDDITDNTKKYIFLDYLNKLIYEQLHETREHTFRIEKLALSIGKFLNLNTDELNTLSHVARFHDIGKIVLPKDLLQKTDYLTTDESKLLKRHPIYGYHIVNKIPGFQDIARGILYHHERWDGNGFPYKLKGEEIPISSRIVNIVNFFDVLTHYRSYKLSPDQAIDELIFGSRYQFDPDIVTKLINTNFIHKIVCENLET
ncbi:HD-GYP domain-containing protein [Natranaerobius trueperi]|uniref:HD-GYP domain-containing protein n=1 Tax=Natranaerobius trueperi TaxID=759412 RepID=A0A226C2K9_9FIRM|nr:HD domain-containing phosphohydrolase [Natranaerobius trueperi]OWZ84630.1 hypothetical protein CDO51_02395 [Natranaerobius trueperi]